MIFVSSPYSTPNHVEKEERVSLTMAFVAKMLNNRIQVMSPVIYGHEIVLRHSLPNDWTFWKDFCITHLQVTHEIYALLLRGWQDSEGMKGELQYAKENNIPVRCFEYDYKSGDFLEVEADLSCMQ